MDVAKYIGLFLLKNNFVYIHGLGNLEIRKKPASYDGEKLQPSVREVILSPRGSIDDNIANFIANNEQISISKASNELRDFSTQARTELDEGRAVIIPSIGKFIEQKGKTRFIPDPHFGYAPPAIPAAKTEKKHEEGFAPAGVFPPAQQHPQAPAYQPPAEPPFTPAEMTKPDDSVNWLRVGGVILGFIILIVIVYFAVSFLAGGNDPVKEPVIPERMKQSAAEPVPAADSSSADAATIIPAKDKLQLLSFEVILNTYTDLAKAQRRLGKLKSYGNPVDLVAEEDSSLFYITLSVNKFPAADTARLMDSLKATFNPTYGVRLLE